MLILIAVSIRILINSNIIGLAKLAANNTQTAYKEESKIEERIKINDEKLDDYMQNLINPKGGEKQEKTPHDWVRGTGENIDKITCKNHPEEEYTIGEKVQYTATGILSGEDAIKTDDQGKKYVISLLSANGCAEQTIYQDTTDWVVLGIEDSDKDGSINETLLITTEKSVKISEVTKDSSGNLKIQGKIGYTNGIEELNRICKILYSSSNGEARSMTMDDVDKCINNTVKNGGYNYNGWQNTTGLNVKVSEMTNKNEYPYPTDLKTYLGSNTAVPDSSEYGSIDNVKMNSYGIYLTEDGNELADAITDEVLDEKDQKMTDAERILIFGAQNKEKYLLASRGAIANENKIEFGLGYVDEGFAMSAGILCDSDGSPGTMGFTVFGGLRPVVPIKSIAPAKKTT